VLGLLAELERGKENGLIPLAPFGELKSGEHLVFIDLSLQGEQHKVALSP